MRLDTKLGLIREEQGMTMILSMNLIVFLTNLLKLLSVSLKFTFLGQIWTIMSLFPHNSALNIADKCIQSVFDIKDYT